MLDILINKSILGENNPRIIHEKPLHPQQVTISCEFWSEIQLFNRGIKNLIFVELQELTICQVVFFECNCECRFNYQDFF